MRLKLAALLLASFAPFLAKATEVRALNCSAPGKDGTRCQLELSGIVEDQEYLFLSKISDADRVYFKSHMLGSTGIVKDSPFYARFLPRVYSLRSLAGVDSPTLTVYFYKVYEDPLPGSRASRVQVVNGEFSIKKVVTPWALAVGALLILTLTNAFLWSELRKPHDDGWNYPKRELDWFVLSISGLVYLKTDLVRLALSLVAQKPTFDFLHFFFFAIVAWSLSSLILTTSFADRSSIEKNKSIMPSRLHGFIHATFIVSLLTILSNLQLKFELMMAVQSVCLALAMAKASASFDWRKTWKRSSTSSLLFYCSLFFVGHMFLAENVRFMLGKKPAFLVYGAAFSLFLFVVRMRNFYEALKESREFAEDYRALAGSCAHVTEKINLLLQLLQEETMAARLSLVAVFGDQGVVLGSAGPDAIAPMDQPQPRRLGPFLRRACKEKHLLYAPVAEELGRELLDQGLRHSSLAVPLIERDSVRAVLCLMAVEEERISPFKAIILEKIVRHLSEEILSLIALHVADEKLSLAHKLAKNANSLAASHYNEWGHLNLPAAESDRFVVEARLQFSPTLPLLMHDSLFRKGHERFMHELFSHWIALRRSMEFLGQDARLDRFVSVAPVVFQKEFLFEKSPFEASLLLAQQMEHKFKTLADRDEYRTLGPVHVKITVRHATISSLAIDGSVFFAMNSFSDTAPADLHAQDGSQILTCLPEGFIRTAEQKIASVSFRSALRHTVRDSLQRKYEIHSILSLFPDKRFGRLLEANAREEAAKISDWKKTG